MDPCRVNLTGILPPPSLSSFAVGNVGRMQASAGADYTPYSARINVHLAAGFQVMFVRAGAAPSPDQPSGEAGLASYKQL